MGEAVWRQAATTVPSGGAAKFRLLCHGRAVEGFVVSADGHVTVGCPEP